jgi:hypothetical protein
MIRERLLMRLAFAAAFLLLGQFAAAAPLPPLRAPAFRASARRAQATVETRPAQAGWRVFVDPRTGALREPTREEALELSRASAQRPGGFVVFEVVTHPDGTRSVDLRDAFEAQLVARRNPDGSISMECARSVLGEERTAMDKGQGTAARGGLTQSTGSSASKSGEK